MEIERKFTINKLPNNLEQYPCLTLEQGYLNTNPVVRVRRENDDFYLTYKGKGFLAREEYNLPLNEEAYYHLREKADGLIISKKRYRIPYNEKLTIELDVFEAPLTPLVLAEVEFDSIEEANAFTPPAWFEKDVTEDKSFSNSELSKMF